MKTRLVFCFFGLFTVLFTAVTARAQVQLSEGCQETNTRQQESPYSSWGLGPGYDGNPWQFFAGERITVSAAFPILNFEPTELELRIDGVQVDSDGFPGTVTYQFLADIIVGTQDVPAVEWQVDGNATITVECFMDELLIEETVPVPVNDWRGLLLMVVVLCGVVVLRRRRILA